MPEGSYTHKVGGNSPNAKSRQANLKAGGTVKTSSGTSGGKQLGLGSGLKHANKKE
ncbi:hypothetical protein HZA99_01455 [Candidatus Woesearchaeota archaeon]|nr:hypothetical protein [Candidatus Woesearchaeota archaeon]